MDDQPQGSSYKKQRNDKSAPPTRGNRDGDGDDFDQKDNKQQLNGKMLGQKLADFVVAEVPGKGEIVGQQPQDDSTRQSLKINGPGAFVEEHFEKPGAVDK